MAGEGGGRLSGFLDTIDHPLIFALAITLLVIPMMALLTALFKWLGWSGPARLAQTP